jgi:hypothetical protein
MPLNRLVDSGLPIQPPPDVQQTTLGLDALGRFICNTWDEATAGGTRPFDAVVIGAGMFGGYCAEKIFRFGAAAGLKVLVLEAGPFLVPTHVQNLPRAGLNVPGAIPPANDPGRARELVWGLPWRGNVDFVGQAYCVGGKSLYWGRWCPRLLAADLASWPPTTAQYLLQNYPVLEQQTGVDVKTDFIQGPLFSFDKYSSVALLMDAVRDAAGLPDAQRRLFLVPNAHVLRLRTNAGTVTGVDVAIDGATRSLQVGPSCAVVLALGTIESTRLALVSFPTSPGNPSAERMGRNLMAHWRSNVFARIDRLAFDPGSTLPAALQTGALLVRGSTPQGRFHVQVTASADPGGNSDALLFSMIPDIDLLDGTLANQRAGSISLGFRGVSQMFGNQASSIPNATGRWIDLSPFEADEFEISRAWVQMTTTPAEDALANAMDSAILRLIQQLAGNDPTKFPGYEPGPGRARHRLPRGRDPVDGDDAGLLGHEPHRGRFHHVANAFCADQALFPTVGSVNPTLTGLVLSRRVAEAALALATGAPPPP